MFGAPDIGVITEALYDLPSGDRVRVIDTATVGQSLARILQLYREGATEPVFFGDQPRPEGVVISSDQWAEYETLKEDAEKRPPQRTSRPGAAGDRRAGRLGVVRGRRPRGWLGPRRQVG